MELKYQLVLYLGMLCVVILIVWLFVKTRTKGYNEGKKVAGTRYLRETSYFKRKVRIYRLLSVLVLLFGVVSIVCSFLLLARPYRTEVLDEEKYQRDIILCIDVSTSVDYLNEHLIRELKDTVHQLQGERFGIVIFNTSPVLLVPLTDDYTFVKEQLDILEKALKQRVDGEVMNLDDDWLYLNDFLSAGTLVGNEERGSSLIADGLASCVYDFSELDKERTRVVIFSTDNDVQGDTLITMEEAGKLCIDYGVTVFGIGTKEMYTSAMEEMKQVVEATGGSFFLEEESGNFREIVDAIEKKSKNLVKGNHQVREIECPEAFFKVLLCFVSLMIICARIIRK